MCLRTMVSKSGRSFLLASERDALRAMPVVEATAVHTTGLLTSAHGLPSVHVLRIPENAHCCCGPHGSGCCCDGGCCCGGRVLEPGCFCHCWHDLLGWLNTHSRIAVITR